RLLSPWSDARSKTVDRGAQTCQHSVEQVEFAPAPRPIHQRLDQAIYVVELPKARLDEPRAQVCPALRAQQERAKARNFCRRCQQHVALLVVETPEAVASRH